MDAPRRGVACISNSEIDQITALREDHQFFWLDLRAAAESEIVIVGEQLGLHPLTVEDLQHFDQRAKVEEYDDYVYIVAYGAAPPGDEDRLVETHIVYTPDFLLTAAQDVSLELRKLHGSIEQRKLTGHGLLHAVLDTLVDSYGPLLDEIDDRIGAIEELIIDRKLRERDLDIHVIRRELARIDRVVHRQSEAYTRLSEALRQMPDHDPERTPYFRDVQDHLIRVTEAADSLRDRVSGMFEIYLAALDNRQNVIMKQFTVIAGVFLPLSVMTGFFGMNFAWMVENVASARAFALLGVTLPLALLATILWLIRSRDILGD